MLAAIAASLPTSASATAGSPTVTATVSVDRAAASSSLVSGPITTKTSNQLILAFLAADGPARGSQGFRSLRGCGVRWSLVTRANAQAGAAEIWQGRTVAPVTKCVVTAPLESGSHPGSVTLVSYANALVGSKVSASARSGNAKARIHGRAGSLLYAVGNDWDGAIGRTMPRGQRLVKQFLPKSGFTAWTQRATQPMPKTATVTMGASDPKKHRWNLAVVEVRASASEVTRTAAVAKARRPRPQPSTSPTSSAPAPSPTATATPAPSAPAPTTSATPAPSASATPSPAPVAKLTLTVSTPATTSLGVTVVAPAGTDQVRLGWTEAGTGRAWNALYPVGGLPPRVTNLVPNTSYDVYASALDTGVGEAPAVHVTAQTTALVTTAPAPSPTTSAPAPAPTTSAPAPAPTTSAPAPAPAPIPAGSRDATNTGVPAGTVLRASGALNVTVAGTVIDSLDINGAVAIRAADVTIRRSRIRGGDLGFGVQVFSGNVVIEDTEIVGFQNAIGFSNWVGRRLNIHSQRQDGVKAHSNTTLEDSWVHDFIPETGSHTDGLQMQSGSSNLIIRRNLIDSRATSGGRLGNAAIFLKPDFGSGSGPVLVEGNVLAGGNYTLYHISVGSYSQSGVTIRGNRFKRSTWNYGPLYVNSPSSWSDNAYEDGTPLANPAG